MGAIDFGDLDKEKPDAKGTQEEIDAEWGFTKEELNTCVRVLQLLKEREGEVTKSSAYHILRDAISPFAGKIARTKKKANRRTMRDLDQKCINATKLRSARNRALKALAQARPDIPQVPDGAVTDLDPPPLRMQEGRFGSGSSSSSNVGEEETVSTLLEEEEGGQASPEDHKFSLTPPHTGEGGGPGAHQHPLLSPRQQGQLLPSFTTEYINRQLHRPRTCYSCKAAYRELHAFYDQLCPACAHLNFFKRSQSGDLRGKVALLTGARVKIGFHCGLKLLRAGATLIATSRFPIDCARRYVAQPDSSDWLSRLHVYPLDLRDMGALEDFTDHLHRAFSRLDIIVNNACQTVRRPPAYYAHLLPRETAPPPDTLLPVLQNGRQWEQGYQQQRVLLLDDKQIMKLENDPAPVDSDPPATSTTDTAGQLSSLTGDVATGGGGGAGASTSVALSQLMLLASDKIHPEKQQKLFPAGALDVNEQQLDLRPDNSWVLKLSQVETPELLESFCINTMAPFILNSKLQSLLSRASDVDKYIINVSSMEGKFNRRFKTPNHPHTNMAKAALNMMTRTCAHDLATKQRIYMNSVDTGWINDENPRDRAAKRAERDNFQPPLDEVDGASRILDPIFAAEARNHSSSNSSSNSNDSSTAAHVDDEERGEGCEERGGGGGKNKKRRRTLPPPPYGLFLKDYVSTEW